MEQGLTVSAVITTCRRKIHIVERALNSVLAQTCPPVEVILVDDNRDDEEGRQLSAALLSLVEKLSAGEAAKGEGGIPIIKVKTQDGKHGAQAARNTGIHRSKGELIAFLDDDDEWLPEKLKLQRELLLKRPDAGMCFCRGYRVNQAFDPPYVNDFQGAAFKEEVTYSELLRGDCIGTTSQAMVRRSVFEKVGDFDEELPARQDYEMWIRIAGDFPIVGCPEYLFNYYKNGVGVQITKNWDNCIKGHSVIYRKYKKDIDSDPAAKFNVIFYMAHYHMCKGDKAGMIKYYIQSFFINPAEFWKKGVLKLKTMKKERELVKKNA